MFMLSEFDNVIQEAEGENILAIFFIKVIKFFSNIFPVLEFLKVWRSEN